MHGTENRPANLGQASSGIKGVPAERFVYKCLVSSLSPGCTQVSQRTLGVELAISLFDSFPDPFDAAQGDSAAAANIATPSSQVRNDTPCDEDASGREG